jgi:UDP-2-acetamido-3-amino-2,3-dideoxy-glucuronate N-acetyltransferase
MNKKIYTVANIDAEFGGGILMPIDFSRCCQGFTPKRLFTVSEMECDVIRGGHAHRECKQMLICLQGEIDVQMYDGKETVQLKIRPYEAVYIGKMVYATQKFNHGNSILLVLASHEYDEMDYIRGKMEFMEALKTNS